MADIATGRGKILAGDQFDFTLDGLASAAQMERLIKAISASMGGSGSGGVADAAAKLKRGRERLEKFNESISETTKATEDLTKASKAESDRLKKAKVEAEKFTGALKQLSKGKVETALEIIGSAPAKMALGIGALVGSLTGYADKITDGLQRGISGGIFDYAIAAKTAGVNIEQFSKAIAATDGGFASLGEGATKGAKEFGLLVGSVREATADVGNLGMTNEQLAMFTAQQTKTAISQGFKGRAASELVIKNSQALGNELDTLANRTGKSVMELAAAAMKLAQDPIVANFVQTAKTGGDRVSKAVQQFAASMRGVFGEMGDTLASDALKSALGNLPFIITKSGQNMLNASGAVYAEFERQAKIVKNGGEITAEDQERLRNTVIREVKARGTELRMLANLEGAAGDGARQLLAMAEQANFYNSAAGKQRREEDKAALAFNAEIRKLQATIQQLSIPFLKFLNGIDWTVTIKIFSAFADVVSWMLKPIGLLGDLLGFKTGGLAGAVVGVVGVLGILVATQFMFQGAVKNSTMALIQFAKYLQTQFPGSGIGRATIQAGRKVGGKGAAIKGMAGDLALAGIGMGAASAMTGGSESTAGTVGNAVGGVAGSVAGGALGGAIAGRLAGTVLGSIAGPAGTIIGGIAGAALGQWIGDKMGGTSSDLANVGADNMDNGAKTNRAILDELKTQTRMQEESRNEAMYGNSLSARGNAIQDDTNRTLRNQQYYVDR
jgi:hypothetical protein